MSDAYQWMPPMSAADYGRLKESIAAHGLWPGFEPIADEDGRIIDGHHRARACAELGIDYTKRQVTGLTEREKDDLVWITNVPRRHLTIEQKRQLIDERVRRNPEASDRSIARDLGISDKTVGARRAELEASAEIPQTRRPHQRTDQHAADGAGDDAAPQQDRRDLANHRHEMSFRLTLAYPLQSEEERSRPNGLPYGRESELREWYSGELPLTVPVPRTPLDVAAVTAEIERTLRLQMLRAPLLSMLQHDERVPLP